MIPSRIKSERELIAEICDGGISQSDIVRLGTLLSADPLLQQEYLDQVLIDGLLQYELGMNHSSIRNQSSVSNSANMLRHRKAPVPLVAIFASLILAILGLGSIWWFQAGPKMDYPIPLANISFENISPISNVPTREGWYGDIARIVRGTQGNVAQHGDHMLQLIRSIHQPSGECEVYQAFNLSQIRELRMKHPAFIEATIAVNARGNDSGESCILALELYTSPTALPEHQLLAPHTWNRDLMTAGKQVAADSDGESWQEINLVMPLSKDARFGIVKISVRDGGNMDEKDYPEVFVDNVRIRIRGKELL
jgi:hypothetical protein